MACQQCDAWEMQNKRYYYRWGTANVALIACPKHAKEIIDALNVIQKYANQQKNILHKTKP